MRAYYEGCFHSLNFNSSCNAAVLAVVILSFGVAIFIKDVCLIGETRDITEQFQIAVHISMFDLCVTVRQ